MKFFPVAVGWIITGRIRLTTHIDRHDKLAIFYFLFFLLLSNTGTFIDTGIQEMVIEAVINFQSARYMCYDIIKTRIDNVRQLMVGINRRVYAHLSATIRHKMTTWRDRYNETLNDLLIYYHEFTHRKMRVTHSSNFIFYWKFKYVVSLFAI